MGAPTDIEQYFLELINETRLDPMKNAARYITSYAPLTSSDPRIQQALDYFDVSGADLLAAYQALVPVDPLAWNGALETAAAKHSAAMIAADEQSHKVAGEADLAQRLLNEGYNYTTGGENVYAYSENPLYGHAGFMIDWGFGPGGMQSPAGHRISIMNASYREVGIDVTLESNPATQVGPMVVTQDFGARSGKVFVLGVAYTDSDDDDFYTPGEGRADLVVTAGGQTATSTSSGGYGLDAPLGDFTVTLSGGGLTGTVTVVVQNAGSPGNVKLDVVDGSTLRTSESAVVSGPVATVQAIGARGLKLVTGAGSQSLIGGSGNDTLSAGGGDDSIAGGAGFDEARFTGDRSEYRVTKVGESLRIVDSRGGGDGADLASGIELFAFADRVVAAADMLVNIAPDARQDFATTPEDTSIVIAVLANDSDANDDVLSLTGVNQPQHGTVTLNPNGTVTYTPHADFHGADALTYVVNDGVVSTVGGVSVTVLSVNDTPNAQTDSATVQENAWVTVAVLANDTDVDGDPILPVVASGPQHGAVAIDSQGTITYTPNPGYSGADGFTYSVSDGRGGTDTAPVQITVTPLPLAGPAFRLVAAEGFAGGVGGEGTVFGTNGFQDVAIRPGSGEITLDGSFGRGGDVVRLPGDAGDYTIHVAGSLALLSSGAIAIKVPIGSAGLPLVFDDGVRELGFYGNAGTMIGGQAFGAALVQIVALADGTALPAGADPLAVARLVLAPGGAVEFEGNVQVFGTSGAETVHLLDGSLTLDGSFSRGGDTLRLDEGAGAFTASLSGSFVRLLESDGDRIDVPVGSAGIGIDFAGDTRVLRFDIGSGAVLIGDQTITGGPASLQPQAFV